MTATLLEWETIDADQIDDIMAGKPPRPPKQASPTAPKPSSGDSSPGAAPTAPAPAA
jgi:cell division protease FtsH